MRSGKFEQNSGNRHRIHIIPIVVAAVALALGCYFVSHFINRQTVTQVSDIAPEEAPTVQIQVSQEYRETGEATAAVEADPYEPYYKSYQSYIDWRLGFASSPQNQYYSFYDINGDGIPELLPGGRISLYEILSLKNGESYKYADFTYLRAGFLCFEICEDQVLKLKDYDSETWFFLKANKDDMTFLQGLRKENGDWYLLIEPPAAANADWTRQKITDTEAQQIMNTYDEYLCSTGSAASQAADDAIWASRHLPLEGPVRTVHSANNGSVRKCGRLYLCIDGPERRRDPGTHCKGCLYASPWRGRTGF